MISVFFLHRALRLNLKHQKGEQECGHKMAEAVLSFPKPQSKSEFSATYLDIDRLVIIETP
jgi:hypothetical protein